MSAEEKDAANLLVEQIGGGGRGGGRGAGGAAVPPAAGGRGQGAAATPPAGGGRGGGQGAGRGNAGPSVPQEMNAELSILLGQKKTALEIRDFLSGEFTPLPLADLMAVLRAREAAGTIRLTPAKK
jgi:hypothetical protein